jgi:hypothetical protein
MPVLRYARVARRSTRSRWWFAVAILFVAAMLAARQWELSECRQVAYVYAQHRCMNWSPPPTEVAFEYDPIKAAVLLKNLDRYRPPTRPLFGSDCPVPWHPDANRFFGPADRILTRPVVASGWSALLYSHARRTTPAGTDRLVIVVLGCSAYISGGTHATIRAYVFKPAGISPASVSTAAQAGRDMRLPLPRGEPFRLYVGQTDTNDASHFTIQYEMDRGRGIIDCNLRPDSAQYLASADPRSESVEFSIRDGPLLGFVGGVPDLSWLHRK